VFLVRSVRARPSGPVLPTSEIGFADSAGTPFASLGGRASAEARLRTQLGCVVLERHQSRPV